MGSDDEQKQRVGESNEDDDEDDEWEEELVFVELIGMIDPNVLRQLSTKNSSVLGLATNEDEVVIKLGNNIFCGKLEETIGTKIFFEKSDDKQLKYLAHTTNLVTASRAFLKPKSADSINEEQSLVS